MDFKLKQLLLDARPRSSKCEIAARSFAGQQVVGGIQPGSAEYYILNMNMCCSKTVFVAPHCLSSGLWAPTLFRTTTQHATEESTKHAALDTPSSPRRAGCRWCPPYSCWSRGTATRLQAATSASGCSKQCRHEGLRRGKGQQEDTQRPRHGPLRIRTIGRGFSVRVRGEKTMDVSEQVNDKNGGTANMSGGGGLCSLHSPALCSSFHNPQQDAPPS